jgi:hypothetical protein
MVQVALETENNYVIVKELKISTGEGSPVNWDNRTFSAVISTPFQDRDGDIVPVESFKIDIDVYMSNPILLLSHNHKSLPIGKCLRVFFEPDGLKGEYQIAKTKLGDEVLQLIDERILRGLSAGFIPHEFDENVEKKNIPPQLLSSVRKPIRRLYKRVELVEVSLLAIPSNRHALVSLENKGNRIAGMVSKGFIGEQVLADSIFETFIYEYESSIALSTLLDGVGLDLVLEKMVDPKTMKRAWNYVWDSREHPRDEDGKFVESGDKPATVSQVENIDSKVTEASKKIDVVTQNQITMKNQLEEIQDQDSWFRWGKKWGFRIVVAISAYVFLYKTKLGSDSRTKVKDWLGQKTKEAVLGKEYDDLAYSAISFLITTKRLDYKPKELVQLGCILSSLDLMKIFLNTGKELKLQATSTYIEADKRYKDAITLLKSLIGEKGFCEVETKEAEFEESEHPRDEDGKFAHKNTGRVSDLKSSNPIKVQGGFREFSGRLPKRADQSVDIKRDQYSRKNPGASPEEIDQMILADAERLGKPDWIYYIQDPQGYTNDMAQQRQDAIRSKPGKVVVNGKVVNPVYDSEDTRGISIEIRDHRDSFQRDKKIVKETKQAWEDANNEYLETNQRNRGRLILAMSGIATVAMLGLLIRRSPSLSKAGIKLVEGAETIKVPIGPGGKEELLHVSSGTLSPQSGVKALIYDNPVLYTLQKTTPVVSEESSVAVGVFSRYRNKLSGLLERVMGGKLKSGANWKGFEGDLRPKDHFILSSEARSGYLPRPNDRAVIGDKVISITNQRGSVTDNHLLEMVLNPKLNKGAGLVYKMEKGTPAYNRRTGLLELDKTGNPRKWSKKVQYPIGTAYAPPEHIQKEMGLAWTLLQDGKIGKEGAYGVSIADKADFLKYLKRHKYISVEPGIKNVSKMEILPTEKLLPDTVIRSWSQVEHGATREAALEAYKGWNQFLSNHIVGPISGKVWAALSTLPAVGGPGYYFYREYKSLERETRGFSSDELVIKTSQPSHKQPKITIPMIIDFIAQDIIQQFEDISDCCKNVIEGGMPDHTGYEELLNCLTLIYLGIKERAAEYRLNKKTIEKGFGKVEIKEMSSDEFDPNDHPRGRGGRFRKKASGDTSVPSSPEVSDDTSLLKIGGTVVATAAIITLIPLIIKNRKKATTVSKKIESILSSSPPSIPENPSSVISSQSATSLGSKTVEGSQPKILQPKTIEREMESIVKESVDVIKQSQSIVKELNLHKANLEKEIGFINEALIEKTKETQRLTASLKNSSNANLMKDKNILNLEKQLSEKKVEIASVNELLEQADKETIELKKKITKLRTFSSTQKPKEDLGPRNYDIIESETRKGEPPIVNFGIHKPERVVTPEFKKMIRDNETERAKEELTKIISPPANITQKEQDRIRQFNEPTPLKVATDRAEGRVKQLMERIKTPPMEVPESETFKLVAGKPRFGSSLAKEILSSDEYIRDLASLGPLGKLPTKVTLYPQHRIIGNKSQTRVTGVYGEELVVNFNDVSLGTDKRILSRDEAKEKIRELLLKLETEHLAKQREVAPHLTLGGKSATTTYLDALNSAFGENKEITFFKNGKKIVGESIKIDYRPNFATGDGQIRAQENPRVYVKNKDINFDPGTSYSMEELGVTGELSSFSSFFSNRKTKEIIDKRPWQVDTTEKKVKEFDFEELTTNIENTFELDQEDSWNIIIKSICDDSLQKNNLTFKSL